MKVRSHWVFLVLVAVGLVMGGCAGPRVDEKKPIAEIETESEKLTADDLSRIAEAYRRAILKKRKDVEALEKRLRKIKPDELVTTEVTKLKTDAETLATSLTALTERFDLYVKLLQAKGGDASRVTLD